MWEIWAIKSSKFNKAQWFEGKVYITISLGSKCEAVTSGHVLIWWVRHKASVSNCGCCKLIRDNERESKDESDNIGLAVD